MLLRKSLSFNTSKICFLRCTRDIRLNKVLLRWKFASVGVQFDIWAGKNELKC